MREQQQLENEVTLLENLKKQLEDSICKLSRRSERSSSHTFTSKFSTRSRNRRFPGESEKLIEKLNGKTEDVEKMKRKIEEAERFISLMNNQDEKGNQTALSGSSRYSEKKGRFRYRAVNKENVNSILEKSLFFTQGMKFIDDYKNDIDDVLQKNNCRKELL